MLVTEIQMNAVMFASAIVAVVGAAISVTAMFVSLKSRVTDHEERIKYHANEIAELKRAEASSATQFAVISEQLSRIRQAVDELRGCKS